MTGPTEQPRQDVTTLHNMRLVDATANDDGNALQPRQDFTTLHNMRLVDVTANDDGNALLHVEDEHGERMTFLGVGKASDWQEAVGVVGYVCPARHLLQPRTLTMTAQELVRRPACPHHFYRYVDQSLRRAVELDADIAPNTDGRKANVVGWRCSARGGFRAPVGLIPGQDGQFVEDYSVCVTLRVPSEFVDECRRYGMTPAEMLQGFAGDAAGIMNFVVNPRADGFGSNGSDERDMADAWMQRAYFARFEEAERAAAEAEQLEEELERVAEREDLGWLVQDWLAAGGDKAALDAFLNKPLEDVRGQGETSDGP